MVAPIDVDRRSVGGEHWAGQHARADSVTGPLADELLSVVFQPDQLRGRFARLPDADHHRAVDRRERRGGRDRAARPGWRAVGQSACRIGGIDAVHQVHRTADHHAAAGIEYQQLPQVCTHEQAAMPQKPRGGRHPDHGLAPARPLGRRKGDYRSRLADVEVVEAVEQRAGEAAALDQPHTPALPAVVVVLPLHQRTPGRGLPV
ncbi:Uncharacterised protein [Mycobacterium tuberculosis]|nr:Uncharacterised protein [Mycobacterium tuberculosis]